MYKKLCVLGLFLVFGICKAQKKAVNYLSFGDKIDARNAITSEELSRKYNSIKLGDTINVKVSGKISEVCQKKGCWVTIPLKDDKKYFVKFKDYAFFMPKNSAGSNIILNGKAFIKETSVAKLRHYAKDAGKSKEEIKKITKPKITLSFLADGVLLEPKVKEINKK